MENSKDHKAAAEPQLDGRVGLDAPQVEALIDEAMAKNPRHTARGQARYYEEIHQHLAPLARDLERENVRLRKLLQQVLTDAQAQDVLLEWWHALECETVPNAQ